MTSRFSQVLLAVIWAISGVLMALNSVLGLELATFSMSFSSYRMRYRH